MVEIENIKEAIKTAIQMEKDGYSFYKKAAVQTSSDMGRTVFETLANDELVHLDIFQKLFKDKIGKEEWNDLVKSSKKYAEISIFPKDLKTLEGANPDSNELDALRIGMDSEYEAIEYYNKLRENSKDEEVKDIKVYITIDVKYRDVKNRKIIWEEQITQWGTYEPGGANGREEGLNEAIEKLVADILNKTIAGW